MKEFRLVLAAEGWHIDYVPLCTKGWRKFFPEMKISLVLIRDRGRNDAYYQSLYGGYVDDLRTVNDVDDICRANLAKMARLWLAGQYPDDCVTFNDIDLVPAQREFYQGKYEQYREGKMMLMGAEVYYNTDRGRVPISAMTVPGWLLVELLAPNVWENFLNAWRGSGNKTPDNKDDILNAPYFSDECLMRTAIRRAGGDWADSNIQLIERGYDWQVDTVDRAVWDKADWRKLFAGGYCEAHLLKDYFHNLVVCDKLHHEWGYIPGLKPVLDYIGVEEPKMQLAYDEAKKLYGIENAERCYRYQENVCA